MPKGIQVDCKVINGPTLNSAVDSCIARLKSAGLEVTSYGFGQPSWFPSTTEGHFVFGKLEPTEANRLYALNATRVACGTGVFHAFYDFVATITDEVVVQTGADVGETIKDTAHGFGQGAGFAVVIIAVVAGLLYLRAGRA